MIVGELTHDHEIVRNVTYESLWDNLGMSDIMTNNTKTKHVSVFVPQVLVHIKDAQQVLTWDFDVLRGDILFSVLVSKRPLTIHKEVTNPVSTPAGVVTNTVVIDKAMQCGIDYKVVESALVCKAGESIQVGFILTTDCPPQKKNYNQIFSINRFQNCELI